jgi:hypothetical protein
MRVTVPVARAWWCGGEAAVKACRPRKSQLKVDLLLQSKHFSITERVLLMPERIDHWTATC